ncbi:MAG: hypothetical protein KAX05_14185 [Bacteroidales bacterium]|nr:hypothetical protein [Bacteroidales bacterium]
MRKTFIFIFTLLFLFLTNLFCFAQTTVRLSKPRLELKDNHINIFYDILNSKQTDKFKIWVEITDSTGNKLNARSLSGDIGEIVSGGNNKKITWDLASDSIYPETGIYVLVNAEILTSPETAEIIKPVKKINRGGVIFQSLVFPGWGLSRVNKGKPHWLKGVAGYGCIAASVVYNKRAVSSYNNYLNTNDLREIETFYDNSVKEDNLSEVFAYAAIGIWVTDFIWTIAGSSKLSNDPKYNQVKGFSIKTVYEPRAHAPMVALRYNF